MKKEDIQKAIDEIASCSFDDEKAHGLEDDLRERFITYVSEVAAPSLAEKAKMILSTNNISFNRWCA